MSGEPVRNAARACRTDQTHSPGAISIQADLFRPELQ